MRELRQRLFAFARASDFGNGASTTKNRNTNHKTKFRRAASDRSMLRRCCASGVATRGNPVWKWSRHFCAARHFLRQFSSRADVAHTTRV